MKRKLCDILITIYVTFLLVYLIVGNAFRLYGMYTTMEISETLVYFGIAGFVIYLLYKIINRIKFDIYDALIFLLILFGIISVVYAINSDVAMHGFNGRYEGFLQIITYYVLFLNCKSMDNMVCKKILLWLIMILGCIQAFYAVLQFFDVKSIFEYTIVRKRYYSTGFEVNPNFLGTVMIVGFSLSLGMYFFKKNVFVSIITLFTSMILFYGLLCSGAMSATVALFCLLLFIIILFFVLKVNIWWTVGKVLLIVIFSFIIYNEFNLHDEGYYFSQIEKSTYEIGETLKGGAQPIYGSGRIHIWSEALTVVPDNLWNGVGIDNFFYAFGDGKILIDVNSKFAVDKAHNEYLQKLVTEGIFSFIVYLILLFTLFLKSIIKIFKLKEKNDIVFIALFLGFTSYCIQAFFNISVISVAPIFYIVMGLLCSLVKDDDVVGKIKC